MIRKQEATGKTVDEARAKACALLGVQADDLNVSCEVLEMPQKTGFLGLKLTPAKVCVSVEEPDAPAAAPAEPGRGACCCGSTAGSKGRRACCPRCRSCCRATRCRGRGAGSPHRDRRER